VGRDVLLKESLSLTTAKTRTSPDDGVDHPLQEDVRGARYRVLAEYQRRNYIQ
jgi:hypothetical protein